MKLEETPLIGELSLVLMHAISSQRLAAAIKACDGGDASPVEYALVHACFPFGSGMSIPKALLQAVRSVIENWTDHVPTLSRQLSDALKSLPAGTQKSSRKSSPRKQRPKSESICLYRKRGRSRAAASSGFSSGRSPKKSQDVS